MRTVKTLIRLGAHAILLVLSWGSSYVPSWLVHPYWLDEPISNFKCVWCTFFLVLFFLIEIPVSKQCIPWSDITRHLSWVYTVCPGPKKGTLGKYGLTFAFAYIWYLICLWVSLEERFFPNLNGASLHRAFHVHHSIVPIWLKYCWKECKNP